MITNPSEVFGKTSTKVSPNLFSAYTLTAYKYGLKQLYYFNTFDGAGEMKEELPDLEQTQLEDEDCESCKI